MRFALRVALRYIFSKKSTQAINIISGITMFGITIGSAALIIILSAFNGFGNLVLGLYGSFYPDITVQPATGKVFQAEPEWLGSLNAHPSVRYVALSLEENAMVAYNDQESVAVIKGVDTVFALVTAVDDSVFAGNYELDYNDGRLQVDCAVLGSGLAASLGVALGLDYPAVQVFMPRREVKGGFSPRNAFIRQSVQPVGAFRIQADFDSKYMFTSIEFIRSLLDYEGNEVSAVEIALNDGVSANKAAEELGELIGPDFTIKTRDQQNDFLYKVMRNERWVVFLILTFILLIATFNMIGSISMLVIDKRKDIGTLRAMGANESMIRNIFFLQGLLQTLFSIGMGFLLATLLCVLQMRFGLISIPGSGSFVVTAYPIALEAMDYIYVGLTILAIGSVASWVPAHLASREIGLFRDSE